MTTPTTTEATETTQPAPLVPSFDDEKTAGRKLAIICSTGTLDMAYPGLILANAALGGCSATPPPTCRRGSAVCPA